MGLSVILPLKKQKHKGQQACFPNIKTCFIINNILMVKKFFTKICKITALKIRKFKQVLCLKVQVTYILQLQK